MLGHLTLKLSAHALSLNNHAYMLLPEDDASSIISLLVRAKLGDYTRIFTPRAHARARGYVIGRGVYYILYLYILYIIFIYIVIYLQGLFLSFEILTFRRPFQHRKASLRI